MSPLFHQFCGMGTHYHVRFIHINAVIVGFNYQLNQPIFIILEEGLSEASSSLGWCVDVSVGDHLKLTDVGRPSLPWVASSPRLYD